MWGWDGVPPQNDLGEGLADSETGRFLGTGGQSSVPRALASPLCSSGPPLLANLGW